MSIYKTINFTIKRLILDMDMRHRIQCPYTKHKYQKYQTKLHSGCFALMTQHHPPSTGADQILKLFLLTEVKKKI